MKEKSTIRMYERGCINLSITNSITETMYWMKICTMSLQRKKKYFYNNNKKWLSVGDYITIFHFTKKLVDEIIVWLYNNKDCHEIWSIYLLNRSTDKSTDIEKEYIQSSFVIFFFSSHFSALFIRYSTLSHIIMCLYKNKDKNITYNCIINSATKYFRFAHRNKHRKIMLRNYY